MICIGKTKCTIEKGLLNEDQSYYNESTVLLSSGSFYEEHAYESLPQFTRVNQHNLTRADFINIKIKKETFGSVTKSKLSVQPSKHSSV